MKVAVFHTNYVTVMQALTTSGQVSFFILVSIVFKVEEPAHEFLTTVLWCHEVSPNLSAE